MKTENIPFPSDMIAAAGIKTSAAARKGFELYAGRHGDAAARAVSYGLLSSLGFNAAAAALDVANAARWEAAARLMILRGY